MIQSIYKGIEIEMEMHQQLQQGHWRCDYTLIKHPQRTITIHHGNEEPKHGTCQGIRIARCSRRNRSSQRNERNRNCV